MSEFIPDIRKGDTYRIQIRYPQGFNITGFIHWITLKTDFDDATPILQLESTVGDNPDDNPEEGVAFLDLPPAMTKIPQVAKYVWDIQVRFPNGFTDVLLPPKDSYRDRVGVIPKVTSVEAKRW